MKITKYDFIHLRSYLLRTFTMSDKIQSLYYTSIEMVSLLKKKRQNARDAEDYDLEDNLRRIDSIYTSLIFTLQSIVSSETLYYEYTDQLRQNLDDAIENNDFRVTKYLNKRIDHCIEKIVELHKSSQEYIPKIVSLTGEVEDDYRPEYIFDMRPELRTEMYTVKALKMIMNYLQK